MCVLVINTFTVSIYHSRLCCTVYILQQLDDYTMVNAIWKQLKYNSVLYEIENYIQRIFAFDDSLRYGNFFEILNFIKEKKNNLQDIYPNISIAHQILLTSPETEISCERSFNELKLSIK